jgi:hypothetical protein
MFYLGLDLGRQSDHSALAVVERRERVWGRPPLNANEPLWVRHVERVPLGTRYPAVVERVRAAVQDRELRGRCALAVDATGVGAPVVDMLRAAGLGCGVEAVTITGGDRETERPGAGYGERWWNVPKRDLIAGVQLGMEREELKIARGLRESGVLVAELLDLRMTLRGTGRVRLGADGHGEHDDLAIAVALAVWLARRPKLAPTGERRGAFLNF